VFPKHAGRRSPSSRIVPVSGSYGSRTHLTALKEPYPQPIDERAIACAHAERSGSGGARILVSWFSAKRYAVSATDPFSKCTKKKPGVLVTPGFSNPSNRIGQIVTSAMGARGYSLRDLRVAWTRRFAARNNPHRCDLGSISAVRRTWKSLLQSNDSESATRYVVAGGLPS
jgi:hypothetical protein